MVIPTMILFGLVIGRVWAVPAGALAWLLLVVGDLGSASDVVVAAALGAGNAAVGVAPRVLAREARRRVSSYAR